MDPDPWVTCPYDKVHRVPQSRLQTHIVKCQKNYPKLAICPYNASHRMPETELKKHVLLCPTREAMFPEGLSKGSNGSMKPTCGATFTPKPFLQRDVLPLTDPDHEIWDD